MNSEPGAIDFKSAKKLVSKEHSCAQVVHTRKHVVLSPKFIGQVGTGIKEHLDSELKFYSQALDGIPIAYSKKFTYAQLAGTIMDDCPYIHFDVVVDVVVFQPKIGSLLLGCVNKLGQDHVGCLVHGLFNTSIMRPRHIAYNEWEGSKLNGGDQFVFEVTKLSKQSGLLSITGKFTDKSVLQKKAKRKRIDSDNLVDSLQCSQSSTSEDAMIDSQEEVESMSKHKKKKHKHSKCLSLESSETEAQGTTEKDRLSVGSVDSGIGVNTWECDPPKKSKKKNKKDKGSKVKDEATAEGTNNSTEGRVTQGVKTECLNNAFTADSSNNEVKRSTTEDGELELVKKKKKHKKHKRDRVDL